MFGHKLFLTRDISYSSGPGYDVLPVLPSQRPCYLLWSFFDYRYEHFFTSACKSLF